MSLYDVDPILLPLPLIQLPVFFFFNDRPPPEISPLPLPAPLPIGGRCRRPRSSRGAGAPPRPPRARTSEAARRRDSVIEARHGFAGARRALGGVGGHLGAHHVYRTAISGPHVYNLRP